MALEVRIKLPGNLYHSNKEMIKTLLRNHDLKWRGDFNARIFKWSNPDSRFVADFEKNEATGQTINSFIMVESDEKGFFDEMRRFLTEIGGEILHIKEETPEDAFSKKMAAWVKENEPNIKILKEAHHMPDNLIAFKVRDFEEKKALFEKELRLRGGCHYDEQETL